jgi:hypothetical protein
LEDCFLTEGANLSATGRSRTAPPEDWRAFRDILKALGWRGAGEVRRKAFGVVEGGGEKKEGLKAEEKERLARMAMAAQIVCILGRFELLGQRGGN